MTIIHHEGREFQFLGYNDYIIQKLEKLGTFYELKMLEYIQHLHIPGIYLDIGAFIGTHTVFFAELCSACVGVVAIEPFFESFKFLVANVKVNVHRAPVTLYNCAVGRSKGNCQLKQGPAANLGKTYTVATTGPYSMYAIDDIFTGSVGLIKIDVEGFELEVLGGAEKTIAEQRPHLFIETTKHCTFITRKLANLGYVLGERFNATPTYHWKPK